jgi:trk system potassium uptake protein TrkH
MSLLMIIGGSPGSTAGGIKTTTFAVLILSAVSTVKNKQGINAFNRRLEDDATRRALTIFVIYILLAMVSVMAICFVDSFPVREVSFEVFSAMSTVGLSLGITTKLGLFSKVLLSCLMYFGRVGNITMILAFTRIREHPPVSLPLEKISIGDFGL